MASTGIIILLVVLAAIIGFILYKQSKKETPSEGGGTAAPATPQQLANMQLASDANKYATKRWCQSLGLVYNPDTSSCSLQEESACKKAQALIEKKRQQDIQAGGDGSKYPHDYEWHPELLNCVRVFHQVPQICSRLSQVFDGANNGDTRMPYEQPHLNYCDQYSSCDKYIQKFPRCALTADYCTSKGLSSRTLKDGSIDCYIPEGQEIGEGILGSYFVRKFRKGVTSDPKSLVDVIPVVAGYNAVASAIEKIF